MSRTPQAGIMRQHHLDALRAAAMLLGIGLHASLSLTGDPWAVRDSHPDGMFRWFAAAIHGFRMPMFILLSGYFTMMMWRRRGLGPLLEQRAIRVLLPCILGAIALSLKQRIRSVLLACVVGVIAFFPALDWASKYVPRPSSAQDVARTSRDVAKSGLSDDVRRHDLDGLRAHLDANLDPNAPEDEFGITPLGWAALLGDLEAATILLDRGAKPDTANRGGYSPLHSAAFTGNAEVLELLIQRGGNPRILGPRRDRPRDSASADWGETTALMKVLQIPLMPEEDLGSGRARCVEILGANGDGGELPARGGLSLESMRDAYRGFLSSPRFEIRGSEHHEPFNLIHTSVFHHLWFLWTLCWLVVFFAAFALLAARVRLPSPPRWLLLSPVRMLWLVPLTMIPQMFMGVFGETYGPDTSAGILLQPHLLVYYGIFFAVGAFYFDCHDREGMLGRWWWIKIPIALLVVLPLGRFTVGQTVLSGALQVFFAWAMTFGSIGMAHRFLNKERHAIRYLSDAAYWMYLVHLPIVVQLQGLFRDWNIPASFKFVLICAITTTILLITYQLFVRYTFVGKILNGPRTRPPRHQEPVPEINAGVPTA